jgi:hypothetical protein
MESSSRNLRGDLQKMAAGIYTGEFLHAYL